MPFLFFRLILKWTENCPLYVSMHPFMPSAVGFPFHKFPKPDPHHGSWFTSSDSFEFPKTGWFINLKSKSPTTPSRPSDFQVFLSILRCLQEVRAQLWICSAEGDELHSGTDGTMVSVYWRYKQSVYGIIVGLNWIVFKIWSFFG